MSLYAAVKIESDESLRRRVLYVGGDGEQMIREIETAEGRWLDELAWRLNLKRRIEKP